MAQKFNPISGQFDTVLDKASEITYDDTGASITAANVQDAVDALDAAILALPDPITYKGTWNATTNTPTLANTDTGVVGFLYQVNVAGTANFGAGPITFAVGDKVVNDGTIWDKWDLTDAVTSVNSLTGAVVLGTDNVAEGATNLYFTNERAQDAAGAMATSSSKVSLTYNDGANTLTPDIVSGSLLNADINASAAIAHTKMAALTANRAMITSGTGFAAVATTTATEIGYVNGVTSAIQTQLNGKQNLSTITTAGDLYIGTGSATTARHAVPADGGQLIADSTQTDRYRNTTYTQTQGKPGKNYIQYADLENNNVLGWALGTTGTITNGLPTGVPNFAGATANLSLSVTSTAPIAGTYSLLYNATAATTVGNMVASQAFTVDSADQAKALTVRFAYRAQTNPTNGNWSGTSSSSFAWAIWDQTNSAWISPAGAFGMTQSSGVGICTGTFQTSSNGTAYRIVVYNANATTGALQLYLDDFYVGPQTALIGAVETDWQPYTPTFTGFGTPSAVQFYWRRKGPDLLVRGTFTVGTPTATEARVSFPAGLVASSAISALEPAGAPSKRNANSTTYFFTQPAREPSTTYFVYTAQQSTTNNSTKQNGNTVYSTGELASLEASVPIAGWSSNVQMSNDTDTRVVSFNGISTANTVFTGTTITMAYSSIVDTHAAFSGGTTYTVPVSGFYKVIADTVIYQNSVGGGNSFLSIFLNGAVVKNNYIAMPTQNAAMVQSSVYEAFMSAGTTIQIRMQNTSGNMQILGSSVGAGHSFSVTRLSGPSVIAATESVNASYSNVAGTVVSTGATTMPFATRLYDSHNAFSTNTFTAPVSGKYRVSTTLYTAAVTLSTGQNFEVVAVQSGSTIVTRFLGRAVGSGASNSYSAGGTTCFNLLAGDTVVIQASSSVATSLNTAVGACHFAIERIGN